MTVTTAPSSVKAEFADDLANLSAGDLRKKYKGEASCHANMKRRAREGKCDVDPSWSRFRDFLADMGPRPISDASIERIDNAIRRYGPGLCRWATKAEQTRNRANTRWTEYEGERVTIGELAERLGTPYSTLHSALDRGEAPEDIARRVVAKATGVGSYVPLWADTPNRRATFHAEYKAWTKAVRRPDRRKLISREAFAIVAAANMFVHVRRRLEQLGISEIAPGEEGDFEAYAEKELRIRRNALAWAQDAGRALAASDLQFAARIYPHSEADLERRAAYAEWFTAPSED